MHLQKEFAWSSCHHTQLIFHVPNPWFDQRDRSPKEPELLPPPHKPLVISLIQTNTPFFLLTCSILLGKGVKVESRLTVHALLSR